MRSCSPRNPRRRRDRGILGRSGNAPRGADACGVPGSGCRRKPADVSRERASQGAARSAGSGCPTLAEDSGLCVRGASAGGPGALARYARAATRTGARSVCREMREFPGAPCASLCVRCSPCAPRRPRGVPRDVRRRDAAARAHRGGFGMTGLLVRDGAERWRNCSAARRTDQPPRPCAACPEPKLLRLMQN